MISFALIESIFFFNHFILLLSLQRWILQCWPELPGRKTPRLTRPICKRHDETNKVQLGVQQEFARSAYQDHTMLSWEWLRKLSWPSCGNIDMTRAWAEATGTDRNEVLEKGFYFLCPIPKWPALIPDNRQKPFCCTVSQESVTVFRQKEWFCMFTMSKTHKILRKPVDFCTNGEDSREKCPPAAIKRRDWGCWMASEH